MIRPLVEVDLAIWGTETLFVECGETECGEAIWARTEQAQRSPDPTHGTGQPVPVRRHRGAFTEATTHAFMHSA